MTRFSQEERFEDFLKNHERAVKEKQQQLESLSDDELMGLGIRLTSELFATDTESMILLQAVYYESKRRAWSAGWFWKRWTRPGESEKWQGYLRQLNEAAEAATMERLRQGTSSRQRSLSTIALIRSPCLRNPYAR
jgi:hypothetical protein